MIPRVIIVCLIFTLGCGQEDYTYEVTEKRLVSNPYLPVKPNVSSEERFGFVPSTPSSHAHNSPENFFPFKWKTPEGWQELPSTAMRIINLRVAGQPEAECYLSILGGNGGGVLENINRWRKQMSLSPLGPEELDKLPKKKLLGRDAFYLECIGSFTGMGGEIEKPDFGLVGLILEHQGTSIFIKMVGPQSLLVSEMGHFESFYSSLILTETDHSSHAHTEEHPHQSSSHGDLLWTVPAAWNNGPGNPMRLVTYFSGKGNEVECYITVLQGNGGGIYENINRWRKQMGLQTLDSLSIDNLPSIPILGKSGKLVEISGTYTDMAGIVKEDFEMMGIVCPLPDKILFIKMTGPKSSVLLERNNFISFSKSLHFK